MARTAKKKTTAKRKPRTAAQKAATAKMLAANKRKRAPARKAASTHAAAPKKRRSYSRKAASAAPAKRVYRRNPVARKIGMVNELIHEIAIPAGVGVAGAMGIDLAWGNAKFLSVETRTGKIRYLGKSALAIGGALAVSHFAPKARKYARQVAVMTLGIQAHAAATEFAVAKYPNAGLAGYDEQELNEAIESLNGLSENIMLTSQGPELNGMDFYQPAYNSAHA
ncbi:MAG: hypothetical protein PSX71_14060 [bacterium]|nr:hypothetical protein [bacterium]